MSEATLEADPSWSQGDDLETLARASFGLLSEAETMLLRAAPKGEVAVCGPSKRMDDPANRPSKAAAWGPDRQIRAELIRWLCADRRAKTYVEPKGIQVRAAKIVGELDLSFVSVTFPLRLFYCRLTHDARLNSAQIVTLNLTGSWVQSIEAYAAVVQGDIFLRNGFHAEGQLLLIGAEIRGQLDCSNGEFINPPQARLSTSGVALNADGVQVRGGIFLGDGFHAQGEVRLLGAQIGGDLDCSNGKFINPPQKGLPESGNALSADRINVQGGVFLRNGFHAQGEVRLPSAQIGGNLDCGSATFKNPAPRDIESKLHKGGTALNAHETRVQGDVLLHDDFSAEGEVRLTGAQIGGTLDCVKGTFENLARTYLDEGGDALNALVVTVNGIVLLSDGFRAEGLVQLSGAQVFGLNCSKGTFNNPFRLDVAASGTALSANGINVKTNAQLRNGFHAEGEVRMSGAQIGGDLDCGSATFGELTAQRATVRGSFFWRGIVNPKRSKLDLANTSVGAVVDEEKSWPERGNLVLDGFVYGSIYGPRDAQSRLRWLERQEEFSSQPYRQLAKVLRETGDDDGAVSVLEEMERRRRQQEDRTHADRLISWVFKESIGYGYKPALAVWEIVGLSALGWILYRRSYLAGTMVPTEKDACESFKSDGHSPAHYSSFAPLVYSVENSLPLVKLGQVDRWQPDPSPEIPAPQQRKRITHLGHRRTRRTWPGFLSWLRRTLILLGFEPETDLEKLPSGFSRFGTSARFLRWFVWFQILLGWLLATLFVAGVTGIVRKD